jgi:hypothetical protein
MRKRRLLPLLFLGLAVGAAVASCGDEEAREVHGELPPPPEPPVPPAPPAPPAAPALPTPPGHGGLARDFFEVPAEGATELDADLDLSLGRVVTAHAEEGYLFQAEVSLPEGRLRPRFEASRRGGAAAVSLSLDDAAVSPSAVRRGDALWRLYLPRRTPTALDLRLGAAEADLDLTGVPLRQLRLESGLARANLRFRRPNPVEMERLDVVAGLSSFDARGLGNARFERFHFDGGAGQFRLDFTGHPLRPGARALVEVGVGALTVVLPAGAPVALRAPSSPFVNVEVPRSFVGQGEGRWLSREGVGHADPFRLDVDAGPGRVVVRLAD